MRIALCLSGQPRQIESNLEQLKNNLIIPNGIEDIFVHSWFDESLLGKNFESSQPQNCNTVGIWSDTAIDLIKSLHPKKYIIEKPKEFLEFSHLENLPTAIQTHIASMMYSVYSANSLKCDYEKENNFRYDLVIKTRFDIFFTDSYNLQNYLDVDWKNKIHVPQCHQYNRTNHFESTSDGRTYGSLCDIFVYGSTDCMDKYCSVYTDFEKIYNYIKPLQYAEQYWGYQVRGGKWDIEIIQQNINCSFLRR